MALHFLRCSAEKIRLARQRGDRRSNVYTLADAVDRLRQQAGRSRDNPSNGRFKRKEPGTPNAELKVAHQVAPDWDFDKVARQFEKFEIDALDKGKLSSNWPKAWHGWCICGRDWEATHGPKRDRNSFDSVVEGLQEWVREEEAYQERKKTQH